MTNRISLDQANRVCRGSVDQGGELGLKPLSVAMLDAGGCAGDHPPPRNRLQPAFTHDYVMNVGY
jgi:hypothetical protein